MNNLRVISHSGEPFANRLEAGRLLGRELKKLQFRSGVVLGIPRGGMVVAREVARSLEGELDVALSRKLGAPYNPELAIGAISEDGKVFMNEMFASHLGEDNPFIQQERARQLQEIARRVQSYRAIRPKEPLEGRVVVITDDGVATGATMLAALWAVRREGPQKVVVALPVAPEDTLERFTSDADEVICLRSPPFFSAVGQFYRSFEQVDDEEVLAILREEHQRKLGND